MTKTLGVVLVAVVLSFSGCTGYVSYIDNNAMVEMVKDGASPIEARCAVIGSKNQECIARVVINQ